MQQICGFRIFSGVRKLRKLRSTPSEDVIPSRMSTIFRARTKETLTLITAKYEEEAICATNLRIPNIFRSA